MCWCWIPWRNFWRKAGSPPDGRSCGSAEIDPGCVHIPEIRREERRDTVSSLRLDAVCSTGFRMARGKAAALIESGRVQLNWRECTKPDRTVSGGRYGLCTGLREI